MSTLEEMAKELYSRYQELGSVHRVGASLGVHGNTFHRRLLAAGYDISRPAEFTDEQRQTIADYYTKTPVEKFDLNELARSMGKDKTNVCRAAKRMGLSNQARPMNAATADKAKASHHKIWSRLPHPRGMAGRVHTDAVKQIIGKASKLAWATDKAFGIGLMSPESREKRSERMAIIAANRPASANYSRTKGGVREDVGPMYFRSSWEANYARYLNMLMRMGVVVSWEFEPETFWFLNIKRGVRSYRVDFRVQYKGEATPVYVEVKGWMDPKSKTKIARFKKYYPQHRLEVVDAKAYYAIRNKWSSAISGWE